MPDNIVFVVDDDAAVRKGLRFSLHAAGYTVEAFPSAFSFLENYDPRRSGCLLLDVRMPQMTGLELQQQLNVRGWLIPVIFITGHGKIIARQLDISFRTVELHRAHIIEKLGARSLSDLIRMAIIMKTHPNA
jgi:FixJ family two-component response regulator